MEAFEGAGSAHETSTEERDHSSAPQTAALVATTPNRASKAIRSMVKTPSAGAAGPLTVGWMPEQDHGYVRRHGYRRL